MELALDPGDHGSPSEAGLDAPIPLAVTVLTSDSTAPDHILPQRVRYALESGCANLVQGRVPKTEYRLSPAGRRALERYLEHMEALIRATRER